MREGIPGNRATEIWASSYRTEKEKPCAKSRFTEEQIVAILKESEVGTPSKDLVRMHGISTNTFHTWRKKFGGMEVSDATEHQCPLIFCRPA